MECNCKQCRGNRGIRPVEDVSAVEWARYEKAKRTTDPAKLRALLPPWIRAHMAAVKFPAPFEFIPGRPPVYPNLFTSLTAHSFPVGLPNGREMKTIGYVQAYDAARSFRAAYGADVGPYQPAAGK